ncbi:MAG TPA: trypsin-like peptidase domain-containing protein, partial [Ktedonobacteraceae bacterium]|nr:trypsin-like peptidase domain-containing protein [Ktedonobacteraceae bacterium]
PMDSVEKESSFDNKDVAIIHTSIDNTPFIPLGDSSNISQQDELTIIGFPGNGDVSDKKDPGTFFTSSVNKVYVSAIKKTDAGAPVIQVGGNIEHGDSGGPALDSNGNIVGIVSFGLESSQPEGTTFLQTSASAKELVQSLSLNTRPGTLQKAWQQAFSDYASNTPGHWHKANQDFERINKQFPQFHGIDPYLDYTMSQARREVLPTTSGTNSLPIVGGALAAIVVALFLLLLILLIRRGRTTPARRAAGIGPTIPNTVPPVATYNQYYNSGSQPTANIGPDRTPAAFAAQGTEPDWSPATVAQPAPSIQQTPPVQELQPAYQPLQPTPAAEGQPTAPRAEQNWMPTQQPAPPVPPVQPTPPIQEYRPAYPPIRPAQGDAFGQRPAPNWPSAQSWPSAQPIRPAQPPSSQEYRPTYPATQGHDPYRPATQLGQVTPISRIIPPATPTSEPEKAEPANPNAEQYQASDRQAPYAQDEPTIRKQPPQQTTDDAPTLIGDRSTYVRPTPAANSERSTNATPYSPDNPAHISSDNDKSNANEQTLS